MKKIIKFILLTFLIVTIYTNVSHAENIYFIDFSKVLNTSKAGADAQEKLKIKFETESNKFKKEEEIIKVKEKDLISQKKVLDPTEYQKKVEELRKSVSTLQQKQQQSLSNIAKSRNDAKQKLLNAVNPIIKKYMEQNNIRLVINKDSVILGDKNLEITEKIIEILNQEIKTIN